MTNAAPNAIQHRQRTSLALYHPVGVVDIVGHPAVLAAEALAIMRAVRVLLMYFPSKRKAWGRIPKEKKIFQIVAWGYALVEIVVWSAAAVYGIPW